jgi:hypothetical protein
MPQGKGMMNMVADLTPSIPLSVHGEGEAR